MNYILITSVSESETVTIWHVMSNCEKTLTTIQTMNHLLRNVSSNSWLDLKININLKTSNNIILIKTSISDISIFEEHVCLITKSCLLQ